MGRPKDSSRREQIIAEYQRQMRCDGHINYSAITRAVGLKSNVGSYAKRVVQKWLEVQPAERGRVRECLCCDDRFVSTGRNNRLCDRCRVAGEYSAPYATSPSIIHVGRTF